MDVHAVSSLEDLAFDAAFNDTMGTLILWYTHRPEGKRFPCSALSKLLLVSSEMLIRFVRNRLDQHLVGLVSGKVREKLVKKFYDNLSLSNGENQIDVWVFLEAVLDGSFKELETHIAFPDSPPCSKLIPTIIKWSPQLEKLTINSISLKNTVFDEGVFKKLKLVIQSLGSFQHLTHLSLLEICFEARFTALTLIGEACTSLTHLTIDGTMLQKTDVLALILGKSGVKLLDRKEFNNAEHSPSWCHDQLLEHLDVPPEFLSPICFSLRQLQFKEPQYIDDYYNEIQKSEAAFALRHLPLLEGVSKRFPASLAVTCLHRNTGHVTEEKESREEFQKALERLGISSPTQLSSPRSLTPFSGQLLLTKLDFVNIYYEAMLRAVGAVCPMLKEVTFCSESYESDFLTSEPPGIALESNVNPEEFKSILSSWPKLTSVRFLRISSKYLTPILELFGPGLKHLELECRKIKLADLSLCNQLDSLRILSRDAVLIHHDIDSAAFLPKLKSFHSAICLGAHSRLFEEKSSLVRLVLNCSHTGNDHWGLDQIRLSWSQLEVLAIWRCMQISMPTVYDLVHHLGGLKLLTLPREVGTHDPALLYSMRDHLLGRSPPAKLAFAEDKNHYVRCPMVERT